VKLEKANTRTLSQSSASLPSVENAILHLLQPTRIGKVHTVLAKGYSRDNIITYDTMASRQPMAEQLALSKMGDRSWRWHVIHVSSNVIFQTGDIIIINKIQYRIMEKTDWAEYGYIEYHAVEGFQ